MSVPLLIALEDLAHRGWQIAALVLLAHLAFTGEYARLGSVGRVAYRVAGGGVIVAALLWIVLWLTGVLDG